LIIYHLYIHRSGALLILHKKVKNSVGKGSERERTGDAAVLERLREIGEQNMATALVESGYTFRRYRYQAAAQIQETEKKLKQLSTQRALNADALVVIMDARVHCLDALRWLEKAGSDTLPEEM
jgi:hypothetical protein